MKKPLQILKQSFRDISFKYTRAEIGEKCDSILQKKPLDFIGSLITPHRGAPEPPECPFK